MYTLTVEDHFSSAHQLKGYRGKCENLHGHNWRVVLSVCGRELNAIGLLVDFHDLKSLLKDILGRLDHRNLNETQPFDTINPSSENLAAYIAAEVTRLLQPVAPGVAVESVTVWESDTSRCTYRP